MNARLTKVEKGLSAVQREVQELRTEVREFRSEIRTDFRSEIRTEFRSEIRTAVQGVETRMRILFEESRAETRTLFDGLRAMIERLDTRMEEVNRSWKAADADREKVLANHSRRITALERRR